MSNGDARAWKNSTGFAETAENYNIQYYRVVLNNMKRFHTPPIKKQSRLYCNSKGMLRQNKDIDLIVVIQVFDWNYFEPHGFSMSTACVYVCDH